MGLAREGSDAEARFWAAVDDGDANGLAGVLGANDDATAPLTTLLPLLSAWRSRERRRSVVDEWRYEISWHVVNAPRTVLEGTWLMVTPGSWAGHDLTTGCVDALTAAGVRIVSLVLDHDDIQRGHMARRIEEAKADGGPGEDFTGVLSLLAVDGTAHPDEPAVPQGFADTVALLQALGTAGVTAPLWCATRGAVSVGATDPLTAPAQATVWGLGRVAALEHPDRWGGLVDLPEDLDKRGGALLAEALSGAGDEDQLAVRAGGVFARRLERRPLGASAAGQGWLPRGTVLVSGGTGALGGQVARWLARMDTPPHLLLVSRRGQDAPGADDLRRELTDCGATVTIASCDAGDKNALAELLGAVPEDRPLTAVVHTAAALDDGLIDSLEPAQLGRALHAKAVAAWNLHELTEDLDLDAFVLFASFGGIVGTPGQGNYAPANAYLDALALYRRAHGRVATAVAWGAWGGGGLAEGQFGQTLNRHGLRMMEPELATAALGRAIEHDDDSVLIADIDWERFYVAFTATRSSPLLADLPDAKRLAADGVGAVANGGEPAELAQKLAGLSESEQHTLLLEMVREQAAAVLGLTGVKAVVVKRAFQEMGLDSVTAVELRNRISARTGLRLPVTLAFDYPQPERLADFLREQLTRNSQVGTVTALQELDRLEAALASATPDDAGRTRMVNRMRALIAALTGGHENADPVDDRLETASDDEMFELLGKKFGIA